MTDRMRSELFGLQDIPYRDFQRKLLPTLDPENIIGVRTPQLRALAKRLKDNAAAFTEDLPHKYFEENNLHAFLIQDMRDYDECIVQVNRFLPYVDNWATCDQLRPKCLRNSKDKLIAEIKKWLASGQCYTIRFGIEMLMVHFLGEDFEPRYMAMVAGIESDEYYVNMMIAWYFATALVYQWDIATTYLRQNRLPVWVHNKAIQKAVESRQMSNEDKLQLKGMRRKPSA